jgi:hypothetical protein
VALGAGFRRSAPAEPKTAEPATDHWQPEQATGRLGQDREEEEEARHAQEKGGDSPLEHGVEPDDVDIDKAVDRTEPVEADGETAVVSRWGAATRSRGSAGSRAST